MIDCRLLILVIWSRGRSVVELGHGLGGHDDKGESKEDLNKRFFEKSFCLKHNKVSDLPASFCQKIVWRLESLPAFIVQARGTKARYTKRASLGNLDACSGGMIFHTVGLNIFEGFL